MLCNKRNKYFPFYSALVVENMASKGMKKGVSKDDLRRMMKKMKSERTINHPLAKYPFYT